VPSDRGRLTTPCGRASATSSNASPTRNIAAGRRVRTRPCQGEPFRAAPIGLPPAWLSVPNPLAAAAVAANLGIRIYTVGIGSPEGTTLDLNGFKVHTELNQPLLEQIASTTGGEYFAAPDAQTLRSVYDNLGSRLTVKPEEIEVTGLFAAAAVVILTVGGLLSLFWLGRLP